MGARHLRWTLAAAQGNLNQVSLNNAGSSDTCNERTCCSVCLLSETPKPNAVERRLSFDEEFRKSVRGDDFETMHVRCTSSYFVSEKAGEIYEIIGQDG